MRILLTGAGGLIGSAVRRRLEQEHKVFSLGRRASSDLRADLSDPEAVSALDLPPIDALVHCAGVVDEDFRDSPEKAMHMAMFGADALVRKAVAAGASHLLYVSSAHIYGPMQGHVDETSPCNPVSNYAIAHFATEQVFRRQVGDSVAAAALRPCAVFGDLEDPSTFRRWSLIPFSFPRDAIRDHRIVIRSSGEQRRNFVGTADVAECAARWLQSGSSGWLGINPLGSLTATVLEFAKICAELSEAISGQPCEVTRVPPDGPTPGSDFDYDSLSPFARGSQDIRATIHTLMNAALQEA